MGGQRPVDHLAEPVPEAAREFHVWPVVAVDRWRGVPYRRVGAARAAECRGSAALGPQRVRDAAGAGGGGAGGRRAVSVRAAFGGLPGLEFAVLAGGVCAWGVGG